MKQPFWKIFQPSANILSVISQDILSTEYTTPLSTEAETVCLLFEVIKLIRNFSYTIGKLMLLGSSKKNTVVQVLSPKILIKLE